MRTGKKKGAPIKSYPIRSRRQQNDASIGPINNGISTSALTATATIPISLPTDASSSTRPPVISSIEPTQTKSILLSKDTDIVTSSNGLSTSSSNSQVTDIASTSATNISGDVSTYETEVNIGSVEDDIKMNHTEKKPICADISLEQTNSGLVIKLGNAPKNEKEIEDVLAMVKQIVSTQKQGNNSSNSLLSKLDFGTSDLGKHGFENTEIECNLPILTNSDSTSASFLYNDSDLLTLGAEVVTSSHDTSNVHSLLNNSPGDDSLFPKPASSMDTVTPSLSIPQSLLNKTHVDNVAAPANRETTPEVKTKYMSAESLLIAQPFSKNQMNKRRAPGSIKGKSADSESLSIAQSLPTKTHNETGLVSRETMPVIKAKDMSKESQTVAQSSFKTQMNEFLASMETKSEIKTKTVKSKSLYQDDINLQACCPIQVECRQNVNTAGKPCISKSSLKGASVPVNPQQASTNITASVIDRNKKFFAHLAAMKPSKQIPTAAQAVKNSSCKSPATTAALSLTHYLPGSSKMNETMPSPAPGTVAAMVPPFVTSSPKTNDYLKNLKKGTKRILNDPDWFPGKKRKQNKEPAKVKVEDDKLPSKKKVKAPPPEKRLKRMRTSFGACSERIGRALSQRLYLIKREDITRDEIGAIKASFVVLGSTGNVYNVTISRLVSCTCPDHLKGNICKHIIFVMVRVLKQPRHSNLIIQAALLSTELETIFANVPETNDRAVLANSAVLAAFGETADEGSKEAVEEKGKQKPITDEDDCPVCFEALKDSPPSQLDWCREGCGKSIHVQCWKMWKSQGKNTCVLCRCEWSTVKPVATSAVKKNGKLRFSEGYVNAGDLQGQSRHRDSSSYYDGEEYGYSSWRRWRR